MKEKPKTWEDFKKLTFKVRVYRSGEWVAQCEEVSGIITGGHFRRMIDDAICAAMDRKVLPPKLNVVLKIKP